MMGFDRMFFINSEYRILKIQTNIIVNKSNENTPLNQQF